MMTHEFDYHHTMKRIHHENGDIKMLEGKKTKKIIMNMENP